MVPSTPFHKSIPRVALAISREGLFYLRSARQEEVGAFVTVMFSKWKKVKDTHPSTHTHTCN